METNLNDQRLMVLIGGLRNKTRYRQSVVVKKEIIYFIFSEIVQSESLNDFIQQKLNDMLEWLSEIDVEAVQLNGLIFINTVSGVHRHQSTYC